MLYMPYADLEAKRAYQRNWYRKNQQKCIEQAREARKKRNDDPVKREKDREKRKLYKRELRKRKGIKNIEEKKILQHIKNIKKPLSVLDLINLEQRNYWINHRKTAKGKAEYEKYKYDTNIVYRLLKKEQRQRNKFMESNLHVEKITPQQFMARCAAFNFCCAYCNKPTEMDTELDHVIPRSKGGSHCLANIVPACRSCNRSKYNYEMELWYKKQIFYKKEKLDKIKNLLKQTPYPVKQQSLFPEWWVST